ncbi:MAG: carboxypeptidase-like regulatory domain-containing protein, partial [Bacteroidales bacterium]|nr:carboxypeptidase-like regulatory domain-containing protein [Bacteroidales bacterium]
MKKHLFTILLAALALAVSLPVGAQNRIRVQGRVTDSKGEPLPGAMVIVKGTQNGSMTDVDGAYS